MTVLLTSIGRRGYLAEYFAEAFGRDHVIVADNDPSAAGMHVGLPTAVLPPFHDGEYWPTLAELATERDIRIVLSLHDGEAAHLAAGSSQLPAATRVIGMPARHPELGLDKHETYRALAAAGIDVPLSLDRAEDVRRSIEAGRLSFPLIAKPRRGSASVGVTHLADQTEFELHVTQHGSEGFLYQELLVGDEHGLDVVADLDGRHLGVLARRKLAMAHGETEDAITVDAAPFRELGRRINAVTGHSGLIDVDVIVSGDRRCVIDLNPRFGGGYPFSHTAGADVPALFADLLFGRTSQLERHLEQRTGVRSRKTLALVRIDAPAHLAKS